MLSSASALNLDKSEILSFDKNKQFDSRLNLYSFHCLMIAIVTGFIPASPLLAWKEYCAECWFKELKESMGKCTGHCNITERLLKTAVNTVQSISQSKINSLPHCKS